jgi:hypothetical protein
VKNGNFISSSFSARSSKFSWGVEDDYDWKARTESAETEGFKTRREMWERKSPEEERARTESTEFTEVEPGFKPRCTK